MLWPRLRFRIHPGLVKRLLSLGMTPQPSTSNTKDELIKRDLALWANLVQEK